MDYYPVEQYRPANMTCAMQSAIRHNVPANVLMAIVQLEGGQNGMEKRNSNGSFDLGKVQINTVHLKEWRQKFGFSFQQLEAIKHFLKVDGCYNVDVAAWILRQRLSETKWGDFWVRAANYHSKTPEYNSIYRAKLVPLASRWAEHLSNQYGTKEYRP